MFLEILRTAKNDKKNYVCSQTLYFPRGECSVSGPSEVSPNTLSWTLPELLVGAESFRRYIVP